MLSIRRTIPSVLIALLLLSLLSLPGAIGAPPSTSGLGIPDSSLLPLSTVPGPRVLQIALVSPVDKAWVRPGSIGFVFNLTNSSLVPKCALQLNGTVVRTVPPTGSQSTINFAIPPQGKGLYSWRVNCSDSQGIVYSPAWTINVTDATVLSEIARIELPASAEPGDVISIKGSRFGPFVNVTIVVGPLATLTVFADLGGSFTTTINVSRSAAPGEYSVVARETLNASVNTSATLRIVIDDVSFYAAKYKLKPGETAKLYGSGFIPGRDVSFEVRDRAGTLEASFTTNTTKEGKFSTTYTFDADASGAYTIVAQSVDNRYYNATITINVTENKTTSPITTWTPPDEEEDLPEDTEQEDTVPEDTVEDTWVPRRNTNDDDLPTDDEERTTDTTTREGDISGDGPSALWILLAIVGLVVVVGGGLVGFVALKGELDLSSAGGFADGVKAAFGGRAPPVHNLPPIDLHDRAGGLGLSGIGTQPREGFAAASIDPQIAATLVPFIQAERGKGQDDLAIRNMLLKEGWHEDEVDGVFDRLYR